MTSSGLRPCWMTPEIRSPGSAAGAAGAAVKNSDINFGVAKAKFVKNGRTKGMRVGDDKLTRVAMLFACTEARGKTGREETRQESRKEKTRAEKAGKEGEVEKEGWQEKGQESIEEEEEAVSASRWKDSPKGAWAWLPGLSFCGIPPPILVSAGPCCFPGLDTQPSHSGIDTPGTQPPLAYSNKCR